tara:strand:- start:5885 stop:6013 length:129 start_codon:yes stop_codon:yes gene_type:complete
MSPNIIVQKGPGAIRVKSMILNPDKGPVVVVIMVVSPFDKFT